MTQDDIIRMAREAGLADGQGTVHAAYQLEQFARLIEKHLSYDGIHTCNDQCQRPACVATRNAVQLEREACAELAFNAKTYLEAAAAIRARSEK